MTLSYLIEKLKKLNEDTNYIYSTYNVDIDISDAEEKELKTIKIDMVEKVVTIR